jgi:hypothetical protein
LTTENDRLLFVISVVFHYTRNAFTGAYDSAWCGGKVVSKVCGRFSAWTIGRLCGDPGSTRSDMEYSADNRCTNGGRRLDDIAVGTGIVAIADGRLIEDTDRRAITFTLYDRKGNVVLVVDATKHQTEDRYYGEFIRIE